MGYVPVWPILRFTTNLHGDHKQVKPMPFSVHSTSVACRSLHGNVLSYTDVVI